MNEKSLLFIACLKEGGGFIAVTNEATANTKELPSQLLLQLPSQWQSQQGGA